ncbi:MAG TPA: hypothetical protein PKD86_11040 [Gemmatales bacterium]|nr:hypothetical protein [Gemmatales bacterium]HMP59880.1 hypothetical protein [Gemmatales bacterium]
MVRVATALVGAAAGGALGYLGFFWILSQGFYALVLPGGLLGLGAGVVRTSSRWLPFLCAAAAVALGLFTEWRYRPFVADPSLGYFVAHLHHLQPVTLLLVALGGAVAFCVPFRRRI